MQKEDMLPSNSKYDPPPILPFLIDFTNISNPKVTKVTRIGSLDASFPARLNVARHFIVGTTFIT